VNTKEFETFVSLLKINDNACVVIKFRLRRRDSKKCYGKNNWFFMRNRRCTHSSSAGKLILFNQNMQLVS